ncbi:hypothetical protein FA13DRAFT_1470095 [Coprinellus micaceus]|uniref:Uncharacterized protein n=1 Tax=Coprinellus micaceus TaxID=71717 RepID=A0A4Y7SNA1_COPMI|nr:hypothetical protein FA13DRAFT_1470095 [Coprinellus micaceus]
MQRTNTIPLRSIARCRTWLYSTMLFIASWPFSLSDATHLYSGRGVNSWRSRKEGFQQRVQHLLQTLARNAKREYEHAADGLNTDSPKGVKNEAFVYAMEKVYKLGQRRKAFKGMSRVAEDKNKDEQMLDEEEEETQTSVASTPLDDLFAVFSPMPDGKDSEFDATSDDDTFGNRKADFDPSEADFWDIPLDSKRSPGRRFELAAGHEGDILEDDDAEYEADVSSPPFDNFFEDYDERQTSDSDLDNGSCYEGYRAPAFIDGDCDVEAAPAFTIGTP